MKISFIYLKIISYFFLATGTLMLAACSNNQAESKVAAVSEEVIHKPLLLFDVVVDSLEVFHGQVHRNQFLSDILLGFGVDYATIDHIARNRKDVFDVRRIRAGNDFTVMAKKTRSTPLCILPMK